jgi:hypothetical protein
VVVRDGSTVHVRPVRAVDAPAVARLLEGLFRDCGLPVTTHALPGVLVECPASVSPAALDRMTTPLPSPAR